MTALSRERLLRRGLRLEYITVAWNVGEGVVSIGAALASGSVALLGFGVDSLVESVSALVLVWRLRSEQHGGLDEEAIERIEHRAERLVAILLLALGVYIALAAIVALVSSDRPSASPVGIVITAVSLGVMGFLARAKRTTGEALGSKALIIDAFQTTTCMWLSATTLVGLAANAFFGWWWADPVAALVLALLVLREALEAWRGEDEVMPEIN